MNSNEFYEITPRILEYVDMAEKANEMDSSLYSTYNVKRGLRDENGKGVLVGLTAISEVCATKVVGGQVLPDEGKLFYRGYNVEDLIANKSFDDVFGFEECTYLLLFGELPNEKQFKDFKQTLSDYRSLPTSFVRDIIMKAPSKDMMNTLARSVLTLFSYDEHTDDTSAPNSLRQCLELISLFPLLSVYGYQAYSHYHDGNSLFIHTPQDHLSTAETLLHLLRPDSSYTPLEAKILDIALMLHMEHGGGNNSTFTTRLVSSSGSDTYSVMAAALGSLKGPKHGGANLKVVNMFEDMKSKISDWTDEKAVANYLRRLLDKEEFDNAGLIYGMGHAVYSISDPREKVFKQFVGKLAEEKDCVAEYKLYELVEKLAPEIIEEHHNMFKPVCANIDFYSGFVYKMLGIPTQLFTPIFAVSRIAGWSAHRIEEILCSGKIMRPAYMNVGTRRDFIPMDLR